VPFRPERRDTQTGLVFDRALIVKFTQLFSFWFSATGTSPFLAVPPRLMNALGIDELKKTFLYRLFGLGSIPKKILPDVEREGIVLMDEGLGGTIILRNFRSPGRISGYSRNWFSGSLAITEKRFWGFTATRPIISVPLDHDKFDQLEISIRDGNVLSVRFDVSHFHEGWRGTTECRFRTEKALLFMERLRRN